MGRLPGWRAAARDWPDPWPRPWRRMRPLPSRPLLMPNQPAASRPAARAYKLGVIIPIDTEISDVTLDSVKRRLDEAEETRRRPDHFQMDTPGGQVSSTLKICDAIKNLSAHTVAWVNTKAYSGGAIVSLVVRRDPHEQAQHDRRRPADHDRCRRTHGCARGCRSQGDQPPAGGTARFRPAKRPQHAVVRGDDPAGPWRSSGSAIPRRAKNGSSHASSATSCLALRRPCRPAVPSRWKPARSATPTGSTSPRRR